MSAYTNEKGPANLDDAVTEQIKTRKLEEDDAYYANAMAEADANIRLEEDEEGPTEAENFESYLEMSREASVGTTTGSPDAQTQADVLEARGPLDPMAAQPGDDEELTGLANVADEVTGFIPRSIAGLADVPQHFQDSMMAIEEQLESLGMPTGIYWDGDGVTFERPYAKEAAWSNQFIDMLPVGAESEKDHPVRVMSAWLAGFMITKKITGAMGLGTALAAVGSKGKVMAGAAQFAETSVNAAMTSFWAQGEDENLIAGLRSMGIAESEWFDWLAIDGDDSGFEKRVKNALTEFPLAAAGEVVFGALKLTKYMRTVARKFSQIDDEAVKALPSASLEADFKALTVEAKAHRAEMIDLLGDPASKVRIAPVGSGKVSAKRAGREAINELTDHSDVMPDIARTITGVAADARAGIDVDDLSNRINWARINSEDDVRAVMSEIMEGLDTEVATAVGPVKTHASIIAEADTLDIFDSLVISQKATNPGLPELTIGETLAARRMHAAAGAAVERLAIEAHLRPTKATISAFGKVFDIFREVQRQVARAKADASRRLGALAIPVESTGHLLVSEMDELVHEAGTVVTEKMAKKISKAALSGKEGATERLINNFAGLTRIAKARGNISKAISAYYFFALLGRASTQMKNVIGGTAHYFQRAGEQKGAQLLGKLFGTNGHVSGETMSGLHGGLTGFVDSLRLIPLAKLYGDTALGKVDDFGPALARAADGGAPKAFRTQTSGYGVGKVEAARAGGLSSEVWGYDPSSNWGRIMRASDAALSVPGRGLVTTDEVMKTGFYRHEANSMAYRQATKEVEAGVIQEGAEFEARYQLLSSDPTEAMLSEAAKAAQEGTFTQRSVAPVDPNPIAKAMKGLRDIPGFGLMLMPFQNTPFNISWEGLRRSPLGATMPSFWRAIQSGDPVIVERAWSRFLMGNATLASTVHMFLNNEGRGIRITGDTPDYKRREQFARMGRDTMSIQIALTSEGFEGEVITIPFRGMEPIATVLGTAANIIDLMKTDAWDDEDTDIQDMVWGTAGGMAIQMLSPGMVSGVGEFFEALTDPNNPQTGIRRFMERSVESVAAPGMSAQFVPALDPYYRETFTLWDRIKAKTPGASESLPQSLDAWGRPRARGDGGLDALLYTVSPRIVEPEMMEPIDHWLDEVGEVVARPKKTSAEFKPGVSTKWKKYPRAFERFVYMQGQGLKDPQHHPAVLERQARFGGMRAPSGWQDSGLGLLGELNALTSGTHTRMQTWWDNVLSQEDQITLVRNVISYYGKAALEVVLNDPDFSDLALEVETRSTRNAEGITDPRERRKLRVGF